MPARRKDHTVTSVTAPLVNPRRLGIGHPVIDADGHLIEHLPTLDAYLRESGVEGGYADLMPAEAAWSAETRRRRRSPQLTWWGFPAANTTDLATATFPRLLHHRLEELGIDFCVTYPSMGIMFPHIPDEANRRFACRAYNRYARDLFEGLGDRLAPAAVIPMQTPDEAIDELEHAVGTLGFKVVTLGGYVVRPALDAEQSGTAPEWMDFFGLDSLYDYDPVWAKCLELGVSPTFHSPGFNWGSRRSPSNFVSNHIGHFAAAGEALAKALFLGGVTRRFPGLRFGFLEGGVAWGAGLYADLVARWNKRNLGAVEQFNPANIDWDTYDRLAGEFGHPRQVQHGRSALTGVATGPVDDFARCEIERAEQVRELFAEPFYFGCEADDPLTATAFDTARNPYGARLHAMFSSDIGHWDVPDMAGVLDEACEQLEHGWLDEEEFRRFTCTNAVSFYTATNPDFFAGTAVGLDPELFRSMQ